MLKRLVLGLLALLLLLGVGLATARARALDRLERAGVEYTALEREGLRWRLSGVRRGPVQVAQVLWSPLHPRELTLRGPEVDLLALARGGDGAEASGAEASGGGAGGRLAEWTVVVEDLRLRAGERVLAEGLSGVVSGGAGELRAASAALTLPGADGARAELRFTLPSPRPELEGALTVTARLAEPPLGVVEADGLRLGHSLLGPEGLTLPPLRVELALAGTDPARAEGTLRLGSAQAAVSVACAAVEPPDCTLTLTAPPQPVADLLAPLAPLVPELARAQLHGEAGGTLTVRWPSLEWALSPSLSGLRVSGAVSDLQRLRRGPFEVRVRASDGSTPLRTTGEGTPGWTPLGLVSPHLIAAILASEDAGFRGHPGYDLSAMLEALADNQAAGEVRRGGSTLTQQLVKNLLLSPERTLVRKLREVLLSAELDRALGKDRVLELYVNVVEWGPDLWGVHAAAERYFLKRPEALLPHEAAFLAAILPSPRSGYSRFYLAQVTPPKVAQVLEKMARFGALSPEEAAQWAARPLQFVPPGAD